MDLPGGLQPWTAFDLTVETLTRSQTNFDCNGAMIFDSANPTGGDSDLKTPNPAGHATNVTAQKNILIVSEDGDTGDPDNDASGGVIVFWFDTPRIIKAVELIDIDDGNSTYQTRIRTYSTVSSLSLTSLALGDPYGTTGTSTTDIPDVGDSSWQTVAVNKSGVRELRIRFKSSGAIARIDFDCPTG